MRKIPRNAARQTFGDLESLGPVLRPRGMRVGEISFRLCILA